MNRALDRMGWYSLTYTTRWWLVWFLMLIGIGAIMEGFTSVQELHWAYIMAIALVVWFIARLIVGRPKQKAAEEDKEDELSQ